MPGSDRPLDRLEYDVVDVFTDRPFAGNQLAVVHGGDELSTAQCLAVAREFGYSETTFPSVTNDGQGRRREYGTRIFTPEREIPFAGHPTLGTAWVLRSRGLLDADECVQVCGVGRIGVRFAGPADTARVELSATPRDLVGPLPRDLVRDLLHLVGLSLSDAAGEGWVAGCGLSFVHLPVTEEAVVRAVPAGRGFGPLVERLAALGPADDLLDALNVYAVTGGAPPLGVHSRVFVLGAGVGEDAATGSAAAGLGMALVASGLLPDGGRYDITQGVEMDRPSRLYARVEVGDRPDVGGGTGIGDGTGVGGRTDVGSRTDVGGRTGASHGRASRCHVAGQVQPVATGRIAVP